MKQERYLIYATNCLKLLVKAADPSERMMLLQMAQTWLHLSAKAKGIDDLLHTAVEIGIIPARSKMH
jgi:hypothetical protein